MYILWIIIPSASSVCMRRHIRILCLAAAWPSVAGWRGWGWWRGEERVKFALIQQIYAVMGFKWVEFIKAVR